MCNNSKERSPLKRFLIVCPERTIDKNCHSYWKSNRCGYTYNINEAGRYTQEEVDEICNQPYVNDYPIEIKEK